MNLTATATSNSTIDVEGEIHIHDQLIAKEIRIKYCEVRRDQDDKLCEPCKNLTVNMNTQMKSLTGLRSYTKHNITAQAIGIVARDGTVVTTPHGSESEPIYAETHEGGEDFVFLKRQVLID